MNSPALALAALAALYIAVYRSDPLAPFHVKRPGSWNGVFSALGLPFRARAGRPHFALLAFAGAFVDAYALYLGLLQCLVLELAGSSVIVFAITRCVPVPSPPREIALPYPRPGRAEFAGPRRGEGGRAASAAEVDVSGLRLFYVSNLNANFFSLPEPRERGIRLSDQLAMFIQQGRPRFAWVQVIYARAGAQGLLEGTKRALLHDRQELSYSGKNPAWLSHIDPLVKKVNEGLSSDLFAVSVRGILMGADPYGLSLPFGDEVDSLVPFETRDPNLLYSLARRKMPELKAPRYPGPRHETAFFLTNRPAPFVLPPARSVETAPAGLEPIAVEREGAGDVFEALPVPVIDESFHMPSDGIVELVYDGSLHVLFGGSYGRALSSLGVSGQRYDPLEALKSALQARA